MRAGGTSRDPASRSTPTRRGGKTSPVTVELFGPTGRRMAVTIRDIAKAVGVSYQTAADVLGDSDLRRERYRKQTQELILRTAGKMGYRPNAAARAVTTGRFNNIALLLSTAGVRSYLPETLLDGILSELTPLQMHLSLARIDDRGLTDPLFMPRILREWSADGLLVDYTHDVPPQMTQLIEANELPAVWVNNHRENDAVYPDDQGAGELLTRHLISLGHTRVAYLCLIHGRDVMPMMHYSVGARIEGYERAMKKAKLKVHTVIPDRGIGGTDLDAWLRAFLARKDAPTAVICESHRDASAAMIAAAALGLAVPRDLSVTGFSDGEWSVGGTVITTVRTDRARLGAAAVRMLIRKINQRLRLPAERIACELAPGQSVAPPGR